MMWLSDVEQKRRIHIRLAKQQTDHWKEPRELYSVTESKMNKAVRLACLKHMKQHVNFVKGFFGPTAVNDNFSILDLEIKRLRLPHWQE